MKTKIFTISLALFFATMLNAQTVPNGGFENWADGEPVDWTTSNVGPILTITQTDDSHSGSYAVKGQTDSNETTIPSMETGYDNFGFPVSVAYDQLSFWYQYVEQGSDMILVTVTIADENYSTLGYGSLEIDDATEEYTLAIIPIEYDEAGTPAVAIVNIGLYDGTGGDPPDKETYFIIDDVELSGGGVGIGENAEIEVNVYPNPTSDILKIDAEQQIQRIKLVNLVGQIIYESNVEAKSYQVNLNNVPDGIYILNLETEGGITAKKIMVDSD